MSIYMAPMDYQVLYPSGDDLYGNMMVGGNGDPYGTPEFDVGDDQGMENWGFCTWDSTWNSNGNTPFDTGSIAVAFSAATDGSESLQVGSNDPVTYTGDSIDSISSVVFQAAVTVPAEASWSGISVEFFSGSTLVETESDLTGPVANTTETPSTPVAEQLMTITPDVSGVTSAIATGTMRLQAPAGTTPGATGMFCNIFIFGSHGSMVAG
jgi:hypothetical protein